MTGDAASQGEPPAERRPERRVDPRLLEFLSAR